MWLGSRWNTAGFSAVCCRLVDKLSLLIESKIRLTLNYLTVRHRNGLKIKTKTSWLHGIKIPWPCLKFLPCKFRPELEFWFIIMGSFSAEWNLPHDGVQNSSCCHKPTSCMSGWSPRSRGFQIVEFSLLSPLLWSNQFSPPCPDGFLCCWLPASNPALFLIACCASSLVILHLELAAWSPCNPGWKNWSSVQLSAARLYQPTGTPIHYTTYLTKYLTCVTPWPTGVSFCTKVNSPTATILIPAFFFLPHQSTHTMRAASSYKQSIWEVGSSVKFV